MNLYCIAGLGADERLFKNLHPAGYNLKFINWITPHKNEHISDYATRLIPQINQEEPFCLLGVSLGGIVAMELSVQLSPEKVFVISSVKSSSEFPFYFKIFKSFSFLINSKVIKAGKPFIELFFGKMNKQDKALIYRMIDDADDVFTPWAAKAVLGWDFPPEIAHQTSIIHILGDKDLIFTNGHVKDAIIIKGGTHVMILNKAEEINQMITSV